ncbi:MAG TPA: CpsD/CapB family tyrosine-protein kinase [Dehalococcoidia bacterium]|nr:CpsD/CapB family tyrosine-protein kinase [Dehalococcoidia bacterium]
MPARPERIEGPAETWDRFGYGEIERTLRHLCTQIGWTQVPEGPGHVLSVSSAVPREGKTSVSVALGTVMARDHSCDVLVIECDLWQPRLRTDLGLGSVAGLSRLLEWNDELEFGLHQSAIPNLWILPGGSVPDQPSRLLRSQRMQRLIDEARERFPFVILDLPAVLYSSDAAVLAQLSEGTLFVVRTGNTDVRAVEQAMGLLQGANVYGVLLNRVRPALPDLVRRLMQA